MYAGYLISKDPKDASLKLEKTFARGKQEDLIKDIEVNDNAISH